MKKHILPLFLSILIPFAAVFTACGTEGSGASNENAPPERSDAASLASETGDDVTSVIDVADKDYPVLCGGFMQPGPFAGYSVERMKQHLGYMREVGMDTLVLQWTFNVEGEKVTRAYFAQSFEQSQKSASFDASGERFLETLLSAAEQTGIKVFVGLNDSAEWWQKGVNDRGWIEAQASLGVAGAKTIYEKYAKEYPNALHGWYFVFEFFNMKANATQVENAAYLLSLYRDGLYSFSPEMPMMLSPYIASAGADESETERLWKSVFAETSFRPGDIYCCQDSVGAGHITIDRLEGYFKAIKAAVDTKPGLVFWANNEDFTQSDWTTAPLDRFVRQLEISDKYVEAHVTFAYSHYQNPDTGKTGYHNAYKTYYETGVIPETVLKAPEVGYKPSADGSSVAISGKAKNENDSLMGVRIYKNGEIVKFIDFSQNYGKKEYDFSYTDFNLSGTGSAGYRVCAVDYFANESPFYEFNVDFNGKNGKNAALGKKYTLAVQPESQYPDEEGASLTDGKLAEAAYYDPAWAGFLGRPEITVDLGKVETGIYGIEISTLGGGSAGVYAPTNISVSVSDDGKSFRPAVTRDFDADPGVDSADRVARSILLAENVSGRYVKISVATNQSWIFIDEISVFAE